MLKGFITVLNAIKAVLLVEVDLGGDGMEAYLFSFVPMSICLLGSAFAEVSMALAIGISWLGFMWGASVYIRSYYTHWARTHWGQPNPLTGFFWWAACIIGIVCGLASFVLPAYSYILSGSATLLASVPVFIKYMQVRKHRLDNTWPDLPAPMPIRD